MPKRTADRFTDLYVERIKKTADRQELADADCSGLYLVVQPSGSKSWAMRYRHGGKPKKMTIGNYPTMSLKDARIAGHKFLAQVRDGIDPATGRNENDKGSDPFEVVLEDFFARYTRIKNKNAKAIEQNFDHDVLPLWRGRAVGSITRNDVRDLVDGMLKRGVKAKTNITFARMKKFFHWCIERDILEVSPLNKMPMPSDQENRDRVLANDELRLVWLAAERIGYPYGSAVQGMILTGQRKTEVSEMARSELFDYLGDQEDHHWIIPQERTKNGEENVLPLTPGMLRLLADQPKIAGQNDWLMFRNRDLNKLGGWSSAKDKIDAMTLRIKREEADARGEDAGKVKPMEHWTLHDLRRTAATNMGALRVEPHIIEAILNHVSTGVIKGVARTYNRYAYYSQKFEALQAWENMLDRIVNPQDNVVELRRA